MIAIKHEEYIAEESEIDSKYFDTRTLKVVLKRGITNSQNVDELIRLMQRYEFVIIINKTNNALNNRWLGLKTKAFLTDVNMQFVKTVSAGIKKNENDVTITDKMNFDHQLLRLAQISFKYSRFLNDPYLNSDKAKQIYKDIVINSFEKPNLFFATARTRGKTFGFSLFSMDNITQTSTIKLIAIDPKYKGAGTGRLLMHSIESYLSRVGISSLRVGTQLDNIDAINFYHTYGFIQDECNSVYHFWPSKV